MHPTPTLPHSHRHPHPHHIHQHAGTHPPTHTHTPHNPLPQAGVERLSKLRVLYLSNNKLKDLSELDRLAGLAALEDLLLVGNPLYVEQSKDPATLAAYRVEVRARQGAAA